MICPKCKKEYSDPVWFIHIEACEAKPIVKAETKSPSKTKPVASKGVKK